MSNATSASTPVTSVELQKQLEYLRDEIMNDVREQVSCLATHLEFSALRGVMLGYLDAEPRKTIERMLAVMAPADRDLDAVRERQYARKLERLRRRILATVGTTCQ